MSSGQTVGWLRHRGTHGGQGNKPYGARRRPLGDGQGCVDWKRTYATWDEAEQACLRLYVEQGTVTFAYLCNGCGQWHGSKFAPRSHGGDVGAYGTALGRMTWLLPPSASGVTV